jgi:hypothetical protein
MEGDTATALGIHPPHTVRIDLAGWVQDWPYEVVQVTGAQLVIRDPAHRRLLYYPYEHRHQLPDGSWLFVGGITHGDFTVSAGPERLPSMDTAGPADDWSGS